jgi:hypothetical protein
MQQLRFQKWCQTELIVVLPVFLNAEKCLKWKKRDLARNEYPKEENC